MSTLSLLLPPQRALAHGLAPKTCHLTKGPWYLLSSRDTHEEAYKRAWVFTTMCLLWVCLSNQYREQEVLPKVEKSRSDPWRGAHHQGSQRPLRGQSLAKLSLALALLRSFSPSHGHLSPLERFFLSHTPWTACASKGDPRAPRLESPYLSKP